MQKESISKPAGQGSREPWFLSEKGIQIKAHSASGPVAVATTHPHNSLEQRQADAKRIWACINACQGISTEALEAGVVPQLALQLERCADLLAECESADPDERTDAIADARTVISKTKGGMR